MIKFSGKKVLTYINGNTETSAWTGLGPPGSVQVEGVDE